MITAIDALFAIAVAEVLEGWSLYFEMLAKPIEASERLLIYFFADNCRPRTRLQRAGAKPFYSQLPASFSIPVLF
jgi:hypothetical protein